MSKEEYGIFDRNLFMRKHKKAFGVVVSDWDLTMVEPHTTATLVEWLTTYHTQFLSNFPDEMSTSDMREKMPKQLSEQVELLKPLFVQLAAGIIKKQTTSLRLKKELLEDVTSSFYFGVASFNDGIANLTRALGSAFGFTKGDIAEFNQMLADELNIPIQKVKSLSTGPGYIKYVWDQAWEYEPQLKSKLTLDAIEASMEQGESPKAKHQFVRKVLKKVNGLGRTYYSHDLYVLEDNTDNIQYLDTPPNPNEPFSLPRAKTVKFDRDLSDEHRTKLAHEKFCSMVSETYRRDGIVQVMPSLRREWEERNRLRANSVVVRFIQDGVGDIIHKDSQGVILREENVLKYKAAGNKHKRMTAKIIVAFVEELKYKREVAVKDPEYHTGEGGFSFFSSDPEKCYIVKCFMEQEGLQTLDDLFLMTKSDLRQAYNQFKRGFLNRNPEFGAPPLSKTISMSGLNPFSRELAGEILSSMSDTDLGDINFELIEEFIEVVNDELISGRLQELYNEGLSSFFWVEHAEECSAIPQLMGLMKIKDPVKFFNKPIDEIRKAYDGRQAQLEQVANRPQEQAAAPISIQDKPLLFSASTNLSSRRKTQVTSSKVQAKVTAGRKKATDSKRRRRRAR